MEANFPNLNGRFALDNFFLKMIFSMSGKSISLHKNMVATCALYALFKADALHALFRY